MRCKEKKPFTRRRLRRQRGLERRKAVPVPKFKFRNRHRFFRSSASNVFHRYAAHSRTPPRATAIRTRGCWGAWAITVSTGLRQHTTTTGCIWISTQRTSIPAVRIVVPTLFNCAASRNKRGRRAFDGTDWGLRTRAWAHFSILILRITLPAPGFRRHTSGSLGGVCDEGSGWSASAGETNGNGLRSLTTGFQSTWEHNRAFGFQLRCLVK